MGTMPQVSDLNAQKPWKYCIIQLPAALKDARAAPGLHKMFECLQRAAEIVDPIDGLEFTINIGDRACAFFHKASPVTLDADGLELHCDGLSTGLLYFAETIMKICKVITSTVFLLEDKFPGALIYPPNGVSMYTLSRLPSIYTYHAPVRVGEEHISQVWDLAAYCESGKKKKVPSGALPSTRRATIVEE